MSAEQDSDESLPSVSSTCDDEYAPCSQSDYDMQWMEKLCSAVQTHMATTASFEVYSKWTAIQTLLHTYHANSIQLAKEVEQDHQLIATLRQDVETHKAVVAQMQRVVSHASQQYNTIN